MVRNFVFAAVFSLLGAGVYWCLDFCFARMMLLRCELLKNGRKTRSHFLDSPI